jgi:L-alanine-DL-glutamate epimerase-like enolase superfamily enzyme
VVITDVRTIPLQYELNEPYMDSRELITYRQALLVEVETDDGIVGIGESAVWGGPHVTTMTVIEEELKPLVLGEDPLFVEGVWTKMYEQSMMHGRRGLLLAAMGGIDIALWDIVGKVAGLPLFKVFGAYRETVRPYASHGFYKTSRTLDVLRDEMKQLRATGFTGFKMKVGRQQPISYLRGADLCITTLDEDCERVRTVREAVGPEAILIIDANNAWTEKTALRVLDQLDGANIFFLEEPVPTDDIEGSIRLTARASTPIGGYESETSRFGFRELIDRRAVDVVQPDACWTGGLSEARKVAAHAGTHNMLCVPHSCSSAVAMVANMHLVGSIANGGLVEWDKNGNPFVEELLRDPMELQSDGLLGIPTGPGLGIELNWDTVEHHRLTVGANTGARWA